MAEHDSEMRRATKTVATWLGIAAGLAGLEHDCFEILQDKRISYSPHRFWKRGIRRTSVSRYKGSACGRASDSFHNRRIVLLATFPPGAI
jgi:hypothetical protein